MSRKVFFVYTGLGLLFLAEAALWRFADISAYLLPILLANSLVFFGLAIYDTALCFNLVILTLPVKNALLKYEVVTVTFDVYTAGIAGLFMAYIIKSVIRTSFLFSVRLTDRLLVLFAVYALSFFFVSTNVIKSGLVYFHTVMIPVCSYILVRYCIDNEAKYASFRKHFLVAIFAIAVWSILAFLLGSGRVDVAHANALKLAAYFALSFFWTAIPFKKLLLPVNGMYLFAFLICFSRMYLLNMLLSPLYFFVAKRDKMKIFMVSIVAISLVFTLLSMALINVSEYSKIRKKFDAFSEQKRHGIATSIERITNLDNWKRSYYGLAGMWRVELERFKARPLLGNGIGSTRFETVASSHNLHIQLLTYTGMIGWVLFHWFLITAFGRTGMATSGLRSNDIRVCMVMAILIYVNGITNGLFHGDFNYLLFILLALIPNLQNISVVLINEQ